MNRWVLYVDGASRGNPGDAAIGVSVQNSVGDEVGIISERIGETTNNVAEYSALLEGLKLVLKLGYSKIRVCSDSELMVRQMNGEYRVKNLTLKILWEEAQKIVKQFDEISIHHVPREENQRADLLANEALNKT